MNPDLLSANVSVAFMAIVAAALLAHLSQLASRRRLLHGLYAVTAAGLLYLFGTKALGWSFIPREVLLAVYAALFVVVAGVGLLRRVKGGDEQIPWAGLMIEQAAMAYIFAPVNYWKPPLAALLLLYFLIEMFSWLQGREGETEQGVKDHQPPLFPPKRVRGLKEFALAGAAAALVYVFAAGTARIPVASAPEEEAKVEEPAATPAENAESPAPAETQTAEAPAASEEPKSLETAQATEAATPHAVPAETPAAPADTYTAKAGETLKTIAKKLYGKADKLKALAQANPGVKPAAKLKAGEVIKLPEPPPAKR